MSLVAHTILWVVKCVGVMLFHSEVSLGEITLKFMLLFLCDSFAVERGVFRVLLCSIVDIKGSIKLPLLIAKLNTDIKGEVQDGFFSLPSKSLLHNKWPLERQPVIYPRLKAQSLPSGLTANSQKLM